MAVHKQLSSLFSGHPLPFGLPLLNLRPFRWAPSSKPAEPPIVEWSDREFARIAEPPTYSERTPGRTWLLAAKHGVLHR